jgi:hypothetical protein
MMQPPEPAKEHLWLQRLVGEWTVESECSMGPDQPPMKSNRRESVRSLGALWTIGEGSDDTPDGSCDSIMTLGFDTQTKRFDAHILNVRLSWNSKHDLRNSRYVYAGGLRCFVALPMASIMAQGQVARPPAADTAPAVGLVRNADAPHDEYSIRIIVHHWCNATIVRRVRFAINPVLVAAPSQKTTQSANGSHT